jgi:hypothetical protein
VRAAARRLGLAIVAAIRCLDRTAEGAGQQILKPIHGREATMRHRAEHWTTIKISPEQVGQPDERRLQQDYSLHLEREGRVDGAVIYWRRDEDGGRVYYFSPRAAAIAGTSLQHFSPQSISPDNMRDLRQQGVSIANWRHSYVHPR